MKIQFVASCVAVALGLFACAAPTEEDVAATSTGESSVKDEAMPQEQTAEAQSALRIRQNEGCALTCSGGNQTCCCAVGEKCESGATYCQCKPANDPRFSTIGVVQFAR